MENLIKVSDFINHLKKEGLVIISHEEYDRVSGRKMMQKRADLLKKNNLTIREILQLNLLPVTSKQAIRKWIEMGKIKPTEISTTSTGIIKIQTSFLNRLGYV